MTTNQAFPSEAGLVALLGRECCDDHFNEVVGRDSVMGPGDISADVDITCAMVSIVDELLLEIGDTLELHKQQHKATTNTSTLVHSRARFAVPKTEKKVVEAKKNKKQCAQEDPNGYKYYMFIFSNIHQLFLVYISIGYMCNNYVIN